MEALRLQFDGESIFCSFFTFKIDEILLFVEKHSPESLEHFLSHISRNYKVISFAVYRKRDDNMKININKSLAVSEWENETLEMTKVSRLDIAAFLCIASVS